MKPIKTDTSNVVFTDEDCHDLPATKYKYEDGQSGIETVWELDKTDMQRIMGDGKIYLYIMGENIQPLILSTESLLGEGI